jgi:hypothetical protein
MSKWLLKVLDDDTLMAEQVDTNHNITSDPKVVP